jgi:hypothetical protein
MLLNDLKCKNAAPREKSYKLADGAGLYLEVTPSGGKHWKFKYRFDGKRTQTIDRILPAF